MSNDENPFVVGSTPATRTTFTEENEGNAGADTVLTQETPESEGATVKFPKRIKHRGRVLATIYGKSKNYGYRVAWSVAGQRRMQRFKTYSQAKSHADKLVKDLAKGSQVTALTPAQARDALAAFERLNGFHRQTGRGVSLLRAVSEYVEAANRLPPGRTLAEAITGYLTSVASVTRKDLSEAVEEFIKAEEPRTRASEGQRAQLSANYAYVRAIRLRRFSAALPNTAVCDLSKAHLDVLFAGKPLNELSAKSRNHYRATITQFVSWCVRRDYLPSNHRLSEADSMRPERANNAEVLFYTPKELQCLLEASEGPMQAIIAIGGMAGLRTAELLRLTWQDVWRVPGHIEVTAAKAKTRARRLVEVGTALAGWIEPYKGFTGNLWVSDERVSARRNENQFHEELLDVCNKAGVTRKQNGLRHAFCTYHFALHANENATAQQAGNSPSMIHSNYKGLATKAEAEKWFAVAPAETDNVIPLAAAAGAD